MSTLDELIAAAEVSVNPTDDGKSVVEEDKDEISAELPLVLKLLLFVLKLLLLLVLLVLFWLPAAAAATASKGFVLIYAIIATFGYIMFIYFYIRKEQTKHLAKLTPGPSSTTGTR